MLICDMNSCHQTAVHCAVYMLFCLEMFSFAVVFQGHFSPEYTGSVLKWGSELPDAPEHPVLVLVTARLDTGFLDPFFQGLVIAV